MLKSTAFVLILTVSFAHCQFYYNYEEGLDEPQTETQEQDSAEYKYNSPSAVNEQYTQPQTPQVDDAARSGRSRTHIRIRSRNYPPKITHDEDDSEYSQPEADTQKVRQERRQERKRQRQRIRTYYEPEPSPRVYSPSVFERIGLGEAPTGVYVPQDSLLNVLKSPTRAQSPSHVYQPPISAAQPTSNFVQPAVSYASNEHQQRFYGQPPSDRQSVIPPQTAVTTPSRQAGRVTSLQGRSVDSSRQSHSRSSRRRNIPEPVVDIDSYREHTDEMRRPEIQIMPKVEYIAAAAPTQRSRIVRIQSSRPQVYSPSVFQNIPLGEAPDGIYVPEDSLLNVLRNPSSQRAVAVQTRRRAPPQTYSEPEEILSLPETVDEEEYQPPPPPRIQPTTARRTTQPQRQRHRQPQATPVQHTQRSSHREDVEDFERQPRTRQQTPRRPPATATPRPQTQVASRGRPFKEAKLALAELPLDTDEDGIPGEAWTNYPTLHEIPKTSFSCSQQAHSGYYADLETACQVVHLCQAGGVKNSFLCPNGTIFSQEKFSCQWWYKVNCNDAPKYYVKNDELYKVPEKRERKRN